MTPKRRFLIGLGVATAVLILVWLLGSWFEMKHGGLPLGSELPQVALETLEGERFDISTWRGSPTVLVLFLSGCLACEAEIRGLVEVGEECPDVRIALLSLNNQPPSFEVPFEIYTDPSGEFVRKARRMAVPTLYWIDERGRIVHARSGLRGAKDETALTSRLFPEHE